MRDRGRPVPSALAPYAFVTVHPSALLRAPDEAPDRRTLRQFLIDGGLSAPTADWLVMNVRLDDGPVRHTHPAGRVSP